MASWDGRLYLLIPQSQKQRILRELSIRPMFLSFHANSQALSYVPKTYPNRITYLEQMFRRAWLNTIQLWAGVS